MELREAVLRRRMVRSFRPDRDVPAAQVDRLLSLAIRAPSAGFSQGWDFLVLRGEQRDRFWSVTGPAAGGQPDAWLRGVSAAPVLIVCCSDEGAYRRRYAEPDKRPRGSAPRERWPVPYWDIDTGMAALLILLGAVDEGLGALFFGVPVDRVDAVREAFAIPADRGLVGVIALGHAAGAGPSGSTRSVARRELGDVVHHGRFGDVSCR